MTVFRREDVHSRVAVGTVVRIACLARRSCNRASIIRRPRGPSPIVLSARLPLVVPSVHGCRCRLQRGPQKARQFARDRDGDLGCRFVFRRQRPKASTQALLRSVRDRDDARGLSFAPSRQGDPDAWTMLIVPGRFHQQAPAERVARARDGATPMLSPVESSPGTNPR